MPVYHDEYETMITLDVPEACIECRAVFMVKLSEYPAEPYSWGGSRGRETETSARLYEARIGGLSLNRSQTEDMIGRERLTDMEAFVSEEYAGARWAA